MKYQHKLNGEILFETDEVGEFLKYLLFDDKAKQAKNSILYNLLDKAGTYVCDMYTASKP